MIILIYGISISQYMIKMIRKHSEFMQVVVNVELVVIDVLADHVKQFNLQYMTEKENLFVN